MLCVTFLYLLDLVFAKSIYQRQLVHLFSLVTWSRKKAKAVKDENNTGKKFWNLTDRNLIVFENHAQGQIFFIEKETTSVKFCIAFKIFPCCDNFISFFILVLFHFLVADMFVFELLIIYWISAKVNHETWRAMSRAIWFS